MFNFVTTTENLDDLKESLNTLNIDHSHLDLSKVTNIQIIGTTASIPSRVNSKNYIPRLSLRAVSRVITTVHSLGWEIGDMYMDVDTSIYGTMVLEAENTGTTRNFKFDIEEGTSSLIEVASFSTAGLTRIYSRNRIPATNTTPEMVQTIPEPPVEVPTLEDFKHARTAEQINTAAVQHILDRATTYDSPLGERSAGKVAEAFNTITGKNLKESEVWLILQLLKDVRQWQSGNYHKDSAEDAIAYAVLKAEALENE